MNLDPFYSNPADAAMPYLQQIPGTITPYYQPYIDAGNTSLNTLMAQYAKLINDPTYMMNQIGAGYTASPSYNNQYNAAMNASTNQAAAGGQAGSIANQTAAANTATNLANTDYNNYVDTGLNQYNTALKGYGDINQMGYGASDALASALGSNLASEGSLAYQGQAGQNAANGQMVNLAATAVGGLLGGPAGAAAMGSATGGTGSTSGMPSYGGYGATAPGSGGGWLENSSMWKSLMDAMGPSIFGAGSFFS